MTFKRLDIRQQRPETPEKWETSEMYPTIAIVYCMESFQAVVQAWEHRQSPVGQAAGCPGKPRQRESSGQRIAERAIERSPLYI